MQIVKYFSPAETGINAAATTGAATITGTQLVLERFSSFLAAFTYAGGAPTTRHETAVQLNDTPLATLTYQLAAPSFTGAVAWGSGSTIWYQWGKSNLLFWASGNDPRICNGPFPVKSLALQVAVTVGAGGSSVSARLWAALEE